MRLMQVLGVLTQFAGGLIARRARFVCLCLMLCVPRVQAASEQIEIRSPYVMPVAGVYVLNAQLLFNAPESVEKSVREGAMLNLELQIRIFRSRIWWRDVMLAQLQQRYVLLYHSVSQRFLVRNENSGAQMSYPTFAEAIASLQRIENLPLMDQGLLPPDVRNEISLRAAAEVRSIPRVLGLLLFWVDDYSLESDWYTWSLKP
jgi:Domain of unknown function (DUF4390)